MRNRCFIRSAAVTLLFAMLTYVLPLQQVFHKHTASTYSSDTDKAEIKNNETDCCKPFQFLKDSLHTFSAVYSDSSESEFVYIIASSDNVLKALFFISNKAPPVLS